MNIKELTELDDIMILRHGFTTYNRDYDFMVNMQSIKNGIYILRFKHVYRLEYKSALNTDVLKDSLDDRLTNLQVSEEQNLPGHIWGANYALSYPGFCVVVDSHEAKKMTEVLGILIHEVVLETNVYVIRFFAHDFQLIENA